MAMPQGNVVISDKMQFSSNGGEIHNRQWFVDERERQYWWLRGEFAAANAIIDSLCHHLRSVGEPGEYDVVMGCIQQRRSTWNHALHMQQYFSIADVTYALQQAAWKKQHRHFDKVKFAEKDVKKSGSQGSKQWFRVENRENHNSSVEHQNRSVVSPAQSIIMDSKKGDQKVEKGEEAIQKAEVAKSDENKSSIAQEKDVVVGAVNSHVDVGVKNSGNMEGTPCDEAKAEAAKDDVILNLKDLIQKHDKEENLDVKTFIATEIFDGKAVNVVEGLKLYEDLFDSLTISNLAQLANKLRSDGRQGLLKPGQRLTVTKRPMKGRGREVIQLGVPIADAPQEDENGAGSCEDGKNEAIPNLLQDVIDRLLSLQITTVKPDCCIIDFFNEGDHSQPHVCPPWFGRPVCTLFLTECDVTFGRVIGVGHPGEYKGSLNRSLLPGSLLSMQGKSSDFAKHAISSIRKQRILVTFTKSQPKKVMLSSDGQPLPTSAAPPHCWGPSPNRSLNHARHPVLPKHYGAATTTGVLPMPSIHHPHHPPPNIQPIFIASPLAPAAMPYPTPVPLPPVSSGWAAVPPPRNPPPRLPLPGTGVFLPPPGSGPAQSHTVSASAASMSSTTDTPTSTPDNAKWSIRSNCNGSVSPKSEVDGNIKKQDCNGSMETQLGGPVAGDKQSIDLVNGTSKAVDRVK